MSDWQKWEKESPLHTAKRIGSRVLRLLPTERGPGFDAMVAEVERLKLSDVSVQDVIPSPENQQDGLGVYLFIDIVLTKSWPDAARGG